MVSEQLKNTEVSLTVLMTVNISVSGGRIAGGVVDRSGSYEAKGEEQGVMIIFICTRDELNICPDCMC